MRKPSGRHRGTNKTLSFASVILLGINGIIGSGIFLLPGTLYQEAGLGSVSAIVLAGLSTTLIALSYAMLASKIDDDGGACGSIQIALLALLSAFKQVGLDGFWA